MEKVEEFKYLRVRVDWKLRNNFQLEMMAKKAVECNWKVVGGKQPEW